jgi:HK97 family phage portal protein
MQPYGSTVPPPPGGDGFGGIQINERGALQQVAVYGSVSFIADSIATLPVKQYRLVAGESREMDPAPVIQQPWQEITQRDFITQGSLSLLLQGNLWGDVVGRDENLNPSQVKLIHPDYARIRRLQSGSLEVRYHNQICPPDDVTRAMAMSVPEGLKGLSPIEYLRLTIGLARQQDIFANAFLKNSARPDGWISVEDDLDEDEVVKMQLTWLGGHQGPSKAGLPGVLTGGAKWNAISMSMADAQFLQQMQFSLSVISGMIYRIPPHALGMTEKETSWGAGIEQMELGFVRNTLLIWLCRWEDLMTSWLPRRQFVMFDLSQRLRGDTLQRWSAWQIARVVGAMNGREVRAMEGLPKVDAAVDPEGAALLEAYDTPFTSSPVKPTSTGGAGGDKSN